MSKRPSGAGVRPRIRCALICLSFFWLLPPPRAALADLPPHLKSAALDWVCVAPDALVPACEDLSRHRRDQGLQAAVLPLDDVLFWSPYGDDSTASLRRLAQTAVQQWGARYLMLAGSHAVLPAPLHRIGQGACDFTGPTDAWFACLDGEWDRDRDGEADAGAVGGDA
ncbi:MAG TPA: C25 family cysteine peptidase [Candidatus Krumholzibacteria bacterium]|nr:C25 family cysteine peptidase [Candidatus Krumholzibacteria bacterium]